MILYSSPYSFGLGICLASAWGSVKVFWIFFTAITIKNKLVKNIQKFISTLTVRRRRLSLPKQKEEGYVSGFVVFFVFGAAWFGVYWIVVASVCVGCGAILHNTSYSLDKTHKPLMP